MAFLLRLGGMCVLLFTLSFLATPASALPSTSGSDDESKKIEEAFTPCDGCALFGGEKIECCARHPRILMYEIGKQTQSLRRLARRTLCNTSVDTLPIDIEQAARDVGLRVFRDREVMDDVLPLSVWGLMHEGRRYDSLVINSQMSLEDQRFAIAHEMADWCRGIEHKPLKHHDEHALALHYQHGQLVGSITNEEIRSDVFALELLLPMTLFFTEAHACQADVPTLARIFGVSEFNVYLKFWLNGLIPEAYDELIVRRYVKEKGGPWAQLLFDRFYRDVSIADSTNLSGVNDTRAVFAEGLFS